MRIAGYVLPSGVKRVLDLPDELRGTLLQLTYLQLDAFARGRHVGDAAAHPLQYFQSAFVGVVEDFPGVVRRPEQRFQRQDQRRAEANPGLEQRQNRLSEQAGHSGLGAPEGSEPVADLAVHA